YCFAANVAGDLAQVQDLLPAGTDPHDFSFSRKDLQKIATADLIVMNGLQLEKWLGKGIKTGSASKPPTVIEAAAGMAAQLINSGEHPSGPNPHIWLDPRMAAHAVTNILRSLQMADPTQAEGYESNAQRYLVRLRTLDAEMEL